MSGNEAVAAIRGPVTLITIGALFAINNFTPYGFEKTWPVILIVFGLLTLIGRGAAPAPPPPPPYPRYAPAPAPPYDASAQQAGYRQSAYSQPPADTPAAAAKGGFGTTAPRPGETAAQPPEGGAV